MQRTIHTFRASTIDEAMDLVRRELGPDAVIVESKEIARRRLLPWPSCRSEIEVVAEPLHRQGNSPEAVDQQPSINLERTKVRSLAETFPSVGITSDLFPSPAGFPTEASDQAASIGESFSLLPQFDSNSASVTPEIRSSNPIDRLIQSYQSSLESLQSVVAQLERQTRPRELPDVPGELFQYYRKLLNGDVEDEVARDLIASLRRHLSPETMQAPSAVAAILTALIERQMKCAAPIQPQRGRREIVTIVGPTGVGKTTTIAKLAGHFHLREGLRVGLITVDTYRVGAVEQLRTYADIMQIPLLTAANPEELRTAIDRLDDVDLILIDTAGRSPFDSSKLNELHDIVQTAGPDHVLLLISLAAGSAMISKIADQFACSNPTSLVLTKLDELQGHGSLLSIARNLKYPISYLTNGQDVPDHFESAYPNRLAQLVLGQHDFQQNSLGPRAEQRSLS